MSTAKQMSERGMNRRYFFVKDYFYQILFLCAVHKMILFLISLSLKNFVHTCTVNKVFFPLIFFLKEACKMKYFLNGDADIF